MSPELQGVVVGALIGLASSLFGFFINHLLEIRRDKNHMKLEAEREFRKRLTEGISSDIYEKGMEKLFNMIDKDEIPRSYTMDSKPIDDLLKELLEERK